MGQEAVSFFKAERDVSKRYVARRRSSIQGSIFYLSVSGCYLIFMFLKWPGQTQEHWQLIAMLSFSLLGIAVANAYTGYQSAKKAPVVRKVVLEGDFVKLTETSVTTGKIIISRQTPINGFIRKLQFGKEAMLLIKGKDTVRFVAVTESDFVDSVAMESFMTYSRSRGASKNDDALIPTDSKKK